MGFMPLNDDVTVGGTVLTSGRAAAVFVASTTEARTSRSRSLLR